MLGKLDDVVFSNDDIVFVNADSDNAIFFSDDINFGNVVLNNVSLDGDPKTITHVRLMAYCNRYKERKPCKKKDKQIW